MNGASETPLKRKSIRAFENRPTEPETKAEILQATFRALTAGNLMLYSIIDVTDQRIKDKLAAICFGFLDSNVPLCPGVVRRWMRE